MLILAGCPLALHIHEPMVSSRCRGQLVWSHKQERARLASAQFPSSSYLLVTGSFESRCRDAMGLLRNSHWVFPGAVVALKDARVAPACSGAPGRPPRAPLSFCNWFPEWKSEFRKGASRAPCLSWPRQPSEASYCGDILRFAIWHLPEHRLP